MHVFAHAILQLDAGTLEWIQSVRWAPITRITFGAHFPIDVAAGAFFGYEVGRFSAALSHALGLLPTPAAAVPFGRRSRTPRRRSANGLDERSAIASD
jgi:hypothetical protein